MLGRKNFDDWHEWVEARLSDYIDNMLPRADRAQLEAHLKGCDRCRASLASMRWTLSLLKRAPAPALPHSFAFAVPARRDPAYGFGFARLATVLATLLLFLVVGVDFVSRFGGGFSASAPAPAAQVAAPTSVALVPQTSPTLAKSAESATALPSPPAAPTAARLFAAPTSAPPGSAAFASPTLEAVGRGGAVETTPADNAAKNAQGTVVAPRSQVAPVRITVTETPMPPTHTPVPPTSTPVSSATLAAQARVQPTLAPVPPRVSTDTSQPIIEPLRVTEIALLFLAVFFGALTIMLRRR
ncbi:MAG: zf-HC2 domain-containing protein [Chloroflexota bacterium]|nr:zf-HC2 domain-containing protein [Chloroflexota bacterium]